MRLAEMKNRTLLSVGVSMGTKNLSDVARGGGGGTQIGTTMMKSKFAMSCSKV